MHQPNDSELFQEAEKHWDLARLYVDLGITAGNAKCFLRGVLLGYSPKQISKQKYLTENNSETVRQTLSKEIYPLIKQLYNVDQVKWSDCPTLLGSYRLISEKQNQTSTFLKIDWRQICEKVLKEKRQPNINELARSEQEKRDVDDLFIPLGLVEKKQTRVKRGGIGSVEQGSGFYDPQPEEIVRRFDEANEFFETVIRGEKSAQSRPIIVIGEPGAGKTTLLQKIATELPDELLPVWVSLADLRGCDLGEYLFGGIWWNQADKTLPPETGEKFKELFKTGRVCLLLDGVDEMSVPAEQRGLSQLRVIYDQIKGWGDRVRVIMTCRVNVWEADPLFDKFEMYRNLQLSYPEQVEQYIDNFFSKPDLVQSGEALKQELRDNDRVQDTVKNPLRLALLCHAFQCGGKLPDTQAGLYEMFLKSFYNIKREQFYVEPAEREALHQALGELALEALDREQSNYRIDRSTAEKVLGHPEQKSPESFFYKALELGLLNQIGYVAEDPYPSQECYAFIHPTFQEYLAAISIKNENYWIEKFRSVEPLFKAGFFDFLMLWVGSTKINLELKKILIDFLSEDSDLLYPPVRSIITSVFIFAIASEIPYVIDLNKNIAILLIKMIKNYQSWVFDDILRYKKSQYLINLFVNKYGEDLVAFLSIQSYLTLSIEEFIDVSAIIFTLAKAFDQYEMSKMLLKIVHVNTYINFSRNEAPVHYIINKKSTNVHHDIDKQRKLFLEVLQRILIEDSLEDLNEKQIYIAIRTFIFNKHNEQYSFDIIKSLILRLNDPSKIKVAIQSLHNLSLSLLQQNSLKFLKGFLSTAYSKEIRFIVTKIINRVQKKYPFCCLQNQINNLYNLFEYDLYNASENFMDKHSYESEFIYVDLITKVMKELNKNIFHFRFSIFYYNKFFDTSMNYSPNLGDCLENFFIYFAPCPFKYWNAKHDIMIQEILIFFNSLLSINSYSALICIDILEQIYISNPRIIGIDILMKVLRNFLLSITNKSQFLAIKDDLDCCLLVSMSHQYIEAKQFILNIFESQKLSPYMRIIAFLVLLNCMYNYSPNENLIDINIAYFLFQESKDLCKIEELSIFVFEESKFTNKTINIELIIFLFKKNLNTQNFNWFLSILSNSDPFKVCSFFTDFCLWIHNNNILSQSSLHYIIQRVCLACAQSIPYDQLCNIWNEAGLPFTKALDTNSIGSTPQTQQLDRQFFNLQNQLTPTDTTYPLCLDLSSLQNLNDRAELCQELATLSYETIDPNFEDLQIPENTQNPAQLKTKLLHLRKYLKTKNLALIFYNSDPTPELLQILNVLKSSFSIAWIADQPHPYRSFLPTAENLPQLIQTWLTELD